MAGLLLKNINKIYDGKVKAVDDFNLKIDDKEFIVFVGPSGCGKSTTLRMIAGLEEISSGELYIDDVFVNDLPPKDRDIAMVFQNYALYPHMTVFDNMAFALKLKKVPRHEIEEKVLKAAQILDIEELLDRKPKALSGGQRQRVAMGRSIVRNPKVFLMDEPLSNLDAKLRVQMRIEISRLYKQLNTTFIYVTHDQTEAMTLGTRIVVMKDGIIQQVATPSDIYNHPKNLFVAGFIGSPQMNMFYGKTYKKNQKIYFTLFDREYEVTEDQKEKIIDKKCEEKEIVVGIRPERIVLNPRHCTNDDIQLKGVIDMVENLGAESYVHVCMQEKDMIIKTSNMDFKSMDEVIVSFSKENIHIFDRESELTIY